MPKEVFGHCRGRVKSIPKADKGIGKRVSQIVLKMSGKLTQPGSGKKATYHREQNYASRQTQVSIVNWSIGYKKKIQTEGEFSILMSEHFVGFPQSDETRNYAHGGEGPFRISY